MSDRLPSPVVDPAARVVATERASATTARWAPNTNRAPGSAVPGAGKAPPRAAPTALADVETWMFGAITDPSDDVPLVDTLVTPGPRLAPRERLEIYRFGYRARLAECLRDDYTVLAATLGGAAFEGLASAYVDRHPSRSPNLNAFGRHMASFLREHAVPGFEPHATFLSELAALEWALVEAIHSPAPPSFDWGSLAALTPEGWSALRFVPSESVRVLTFDFPTNAFFHEVRQTDVVPPLPAPSPTATAVYRHELAIWRMDLTPAMTRVLGALLAGEALGAALGRIGVDEADPGAVQEAERSVMIWFREWVRSGFFAGARAAE